MALKSLILPSLPPLMLAPAGIAGRYLREMLPPQPPVALLTRCGIHVERLAGDDQYRVPLYQAAALLETLLASAPDPLIALTLARGLSLKAYPWLSASLLASVDLRTGLERLIELEPLTWDGSRIEFTVEADQACLRWHLSHPLPPAMIELMLAGWIVLSPLIASVPVAGLKAQFRHPARAPLEHYEALLGIRPEFGQPDNCLYFPASWLSRSLPHSDPTAGAWLLAEARRRLAEGPDTWLLETRLRALFFQALPGALPDAARLSEQLALTPRHLRERLQSQNLNLRDLQDEVRRDAACWWLLHSETPLADIAQACGFSEQSAFQRAFRRWTAHTPAQWRDRALKP